MHLAKTKLIELCQSKTVKKYGVCVRILGNMSYVSQDLREVIEEAVEMTKNNNRSILNVCFSYTSRDEITNSVKSIVKMVENKQIQVGDINENLIEQCLFTHGCPPLEILIRTSGEIRLSDFLLWQCHQDCYIHFENCYWPEFSIWKMLQIILEYQLSNKITRKKSFF
ncbi:Rer2p [Rhizophagus irregularis DAOM 197198w]|nr:Rer2p [Rhizophagus irregularis DAOM 197198w]